MVLRGLKTLGVRVRQRARRPQIIAEKLEAHPPSSASTTQGLASHPGHALAARQMRGPAA
jgi:cystathionine beta-lyase/cystathionine gamma-synthase